MPAMKSFEMETLPATPKTTRPMLGGTTGAIIQGNLIGTTASGLAALGNAHRGIFINGAPGNTIGGTTPAARNVIAAARDAGARRAVHTSTFDVFDTAGNITSQGCIINETATRFE